MKYIKYLILMVLIATLSISCFANTVDYESLNQQLIKYAEFGNLAGVKECLEDGAYINAMNENGNTALMYASREGHLNVVEYLLKHDADINTKGYESNTALILASMYHNAKVVKLLLAEDAIELEIETEGGYTALTIASEWYNKEIIKLLLGKGANINSEYGSGDTVLSQAALQGDKEFVVELLNDGASVNARALTSAIQMHGYLDIVKILVTKNPDVVKEAESYSGATGLMEASYRGHFDIVKYLMDSGSDLNVRDKYGKTALMFLSIYSLSDYMKILKYLVEEKNADISIKDNTGKTALDWARETKNADIVNYLNGRP